MQWVPKSAPFPALISYSELFQKKSKQGGWGYTFLKFCGQQYLNTEFTTVKLGGVNCLIQILIQHHNLQRIIFKIFSYQSRKLISNKAKNNNKTCLNGVIQLSSHTHLPQTRIKRFWISNLLSFSSQGVLKILFT